MCDRSEMVIEITAGADRVGRGIYDIFKLKNSIHGHPTGLCLGDKSVFREDARDSLGAPYLIEGGRG